ncbi:hypothetical protein N7513_010139 [Penicillium frequentans]|uniref:Uncharacterized protein n=1 Tax=Penicillium frequentans TaxID=3151616 RepID=A0AAD6G9E1_9EURO|nr:hypothetical protein N7494_011671 [Penicillium glabrum]KAJ5536953.1 hypothetical protein N7513_010139 [Penicillium glabrum]
MNLGAHRGNLSALLAIILLACLFGQSSASLGDHLPDFRECVKVCQTENCNSGNSVLRKATLLKAPAFILIVRSSAPPLVIMDLPG